MGDVSGAAGTELGEPRLPGRSAVTHVVSTHVAPEPSGPVCSIRVVRESRSISVPEGAGPELEKRFAARLHAVDEQPGFLGFELLRPVAGDDRYFVYTKWESEEHYQAWAQGPAKEAHAGHRGKPVASGATLLEFEVVQSSEPKS